VIRPVPLVVGVGVVVAEFSFSVPLGAADAITEDDLAPLEREIQAAVFS
jgi:hypothetical protein